QRRGERSESSSPTAPRPRATVGTRAPTGDCTRLAGDGSGVIHPTDFDRFFTTFRIGNATTIVTIPMADSMINMATGPCLSCIHPSSAVMAAGPKLPRAAINAYFVVARDRPTADSAAAANDP